ncbi:catalase family protein [Aquabacterium sp.]|uniref:catalase family protein n=1 Tax=Aquabacterium sp. TaxID=1872578 RepID=UPI00198A1B38|nr:catalase family protein [Aquabacterium sp.]MBC7702225.1 catalase family protein [Aquabacterium sp.]
MFNPDVVSPFPVRYEARFEHAEEDEAETEHGLLETLRGISEKTSADDGDALRSVHAKSHGLLRGQLRVLTGLPPALAQGLFTTPVAYPLFMRLSTIPGDLLHDSVSTPRGMAIKVVGVEGARLPGSEGQVTQDFVLINGPRFAAPNGKSFLRSLKLLATTTDKVPRLKQVLSAVARGAEKVIESVGGESATLKSLGGHPETHILGETFYSQVPMLHGPYMAKLSVVPISPGMLLLKNAHLDLHDKPNGLRDAVLDFFSSHSAEWEVRVQLCTDIDKMPIEGASAVWPEEVSAYLAVARITVPPQKAWSAARSAVVDDTYSFSPWHGLAAHRPLGAIMRLRKAAYEMSAQFRAGHNHQIIQEPRSLDDLPD